jgi:hypothetical protein
LRPTLAVGGPSVLSDRGHFAFCLMAGLRLASLADRVCVSAPGLHRLEDGVLPLTVRFQNVAGSWCPWGANPDSALRPFVR